MSNSNPAPTNIFSESSVVFTLESLEQMLSIAAIALEASIVGGRDATALSAAIEALGGSTLSLIASIEAVEQAYEALAPTEIQ